MKRTIRRTLSDPFSEDIDLTKLFEKLNIQPKNNPTQVNMDVEVAALRA